MTQCDNGETEGKSEENDKRQNAPNHAIAAMCAGAATSPPDSWLNVPFFGSRFQIYLPAVEWLFGHFSELVRFILRTQSNKPAVGSSPQGSGIGGEALPC
jgi:hypothetical protein